MVCISCEDHGNVSTFPSLVVDSSFGYCRECRKHYAEPEELIKDAVDRLYDSPDDLPEWFFDITYYENGEYKSVERIL
jgi:hypothetical protein